MRHLLVRLIGLVLLALLAAGCQRTFIFVDTPTPVAPTANNSSAERTAKITQIKGTVETRTSSQANWAPAAQDQLLDEGSEIRTASRSNALIELTEGSHIYLDEFTEFTLTLLNPFMDSQLTTLDLKDGQVWVLLKGGALDVVTPFGTASARNAYLSVELQAQSRVLNVSCLQGVCGFGSVLIPSGYKLLNAADNQSPEQMQMADYGMWGVAVPEATQLAFLATEAIAQGSATIPAVASPIPSATTRPQPTNTRPPTPTATPTARPSETSTAEPTSVAATEQPSGTPTIEAPTETPTLAAPTDTETPLPSSTPLPSPTLPEFLPTVTPPPFTPLPPAPIIGQHIVQSGETMFCIARAYGVLPAAIAQANGVSQNLVILPGQVLRIPAVQWINIADGPVCAPQFTSPFPGLPVPTPTVAASPTPAGPPLAVSLNWNCIDNCASRDGNYVVRIQVQVSGGVPPYTYDHGQTYDVTVPHCTTGQGTTVVTSADGQTAQALWSFIDVNCPSS
jgi:LysM repeat protein